MSVGDARHQTPGQLGPTGTRSGEAARRPVGDEALLGRHERSNSGSRALLLAALERENMARAWKRVKANKGSAGVDGLSIMATAERLKAHWPQLKESLLNETYQPIRHRRYP